MTVNEIPDATWYCFEATGTHSSPGKVGTLDLLPGVKGYLMRNDHNKRYYQVVARVPSGAIAGWYIKDDELNNIVRLTVPAPRFAHPERHWAAFWAARYLK